MAKIKPCPGLSRDEYKRITQNATSIPSLANSQYASMRREVVKEIQAQKDSNAKTAQKCLHMVINSGLGNVGQLQPELQEVYDLMTDEAQKIINNQSVEGITSEEVRLINALVMASVSIDDAEEPKAQKILVRGEKAQSRKLYNIRFNIRKALSLVADLLLLDDFSKEKTLALIITLFRTLSGLYDLLLLKFDSIHAAVLREWDRAPKQHGYVDEDTLIAQILQNYNGVIPNLSSASIREAVNDLDEFRCAEIVNGKVTVLEDIVIR